MSPAFREPAADRRRHLIWLALAAAVPVLGLAFDVRDGTDVGVRGLPIALPELCTMRRFLGVACPACGLTRSVVCLMHGDLAGSLAMHRLGWLVLGLILLQIPYRLLAIAGRAPRFFGNPAVANACWITLLVLLVINRLCDAFRGSIL